MPIRVQRWDARTPDSYVPAFGLGKGWPFLPHFAPGASAGDVEAAQLRARAAMLKHGRSVFVARMT